MLFSLFSTKEAVSSITETWHDVAEFIEVVIQGCCINVNKIAVVTGATGGIGKEIVAELRQDHEVIEISRSGAIAWDLADIHAPIPAAIAQLRQVDVLVHAAATGARRSVAEATAADWQYQFNLNTIAPALLTKALLPALRQAHGKVIFINSGAGVGAHPGTAVYAATKHALHGIADALRKEEPDLCLPLYWQKGILNITVLNPMESCLLQRREVCR